MADKQKQGKKHSKLGRKAKAPAQQRYKAEDRRYRNKLARIQRCNGVKAAEAYRLRHLDAEYKR